MFLIRLLVMGLDILVEMARWVFELDLVLLRFSATELLLMVSVRAMALLLENPMVPIWWVVLSSLVWLTARASGVLPDG